MMGCHVPTDLYVEILTFSVMVLREEAFGKYLGHVGGVLLVGLILL